MEQSKLIFIVPSVIYFKDRPLSYSKTRSKFTPEDRARQTLKTIESIRQKAPQAKILLFEMGLRRDLPFNIDGLVDRYVYLGGRFLVRLCVDGIFKGLGEAVSLMYARRQLKGADADFYFKISGRYFLTQHFRLEDWQTGDFVFLKRGQDVSTRLYGFKKQAMGVWFNSLAKSLPFLLLNRSIEHILPKFIPQKNIRWLNRLGLSGYGGAFGEFFDE